MLPLPHKAAPANQPEPQGGAFEPRYRTRGPSLLHEANALPAARATMFYPIPPGSGLLSGKSP